MAIGDNGNSAFNNADKILFESTGLDKNLANAKTSYSSFYDDIFKIRLAVHEKYVDDALKYEEKATNSMYDRLYSSQLSRFKKLKEALGEDVSGIDDALGKVSNNWHKDTRARGKDIAKGLQNDIGSGITKGSSKGMDSMKSAGVKAASAITSALGSQLMQVVGAFGESLGRLDVAGSLSKGMQMTVTTRHEFAKYTFDQNSLKSLQDVIPKSYNQLKSEGVIVDPEKLYAALSSIQNTFSLAGTPAEQLAAINASFSKIEASGIPLDMSGSTAEAIRAIFSDSTNQINEQLVGRYNVISGMFSKFTKDLAANQYNNTELITNITRSNNYSSDALLHVLEKTSETVGAIADEVGAGTAKNMEDFVQKLANGQLSAKEIYGSVFGQQLQANLAKQGYGNVNLFTDTDWIANNMSEIYKAMIGASKDTMNSPFLQQNAARNSQILGEAFAGGQLSLADISTIDAMSNEEVIELLQSIDNANKAQITNQQLKDAFAATTSGYSDAERAGFELEMTGFTVSSTAYQSEVLQKLSTIESVLGKSGILGALGNFGGNLVSNLLSNTGAKGLSKIITGASTSVAKDTLLKGVGSVITKIPVWGWVAAAVAAVGVGITNDLKKRAQEQDVSYVQLSDQLDQVSESSSLLSNINLATGEINAKVPDIENGSNLPDTPTVFVATEFDENGKVKSGTYMTSEEAKSTPYHSLSTDKVYTGTDAMIARMEDSAMQSASLATSKNIVSTSSNTLSPYTLVPYSQADVDAGIAHVDDSGLIRNKRGETSKKIKFSRDVTGADIANRDVLMSLVTSNPDNASYEDIRRALLGGRSNTIYQSQNNGSISYVDEYYLNALRWALYNTIPIFKELYDTYKEMGWVSTPTENEGSLFDWGTHTLDFINDFKDRSTKFYSNEPTIWDGDRDVKLSSLLGPNMQNAETYNKYNGLIKQGKAGAESKKDEIDSALTSIKAIKDATYYEDLYAIYDQMLRSPLAIGNDAIPYDEYPALLHKGEMVIPARRANVIRQMLGQQTVNASNYPANLKTAFNGLVQRLPETYNRNEIGDPAPELSAGTDAINFVKNRMNWTYSNSARSQEGHFDCSSMVSRAYGSQNEPDSVNPPAIKGTKTTLYLYRDLKNGSGWTTIWDANVNGRGDMRELGRTVMQPGDVILSCKNDGSGRYDIGGGYKVNHALLAYDTSNKLDISTQGKPPQISSYYSGKRVVGVFRYGGGSSPEPGVTMSLIDSTSSGVTRPSAFANALAKFGILSKFANIFGFSTSSSDGTIPASDGTHQVVGIQDNAEYDANSYKHLFEKAASTYGIPSGRLLYGMAYAESSLNPNANKDKSTQYKGMMQVNQAKVNALFPNGNIYDAETNIMTGANYLKKCFDSTGGTWLTAISGYNTGPGYAAYDSYSAKLKKDGFTSYEDMTAYMRANSKLGSKYKAEGYTKKIYDKAGLTPQGVYLEEGGIVKNTPGGIHAIIGEGKSDEAVVPLNDREDYLGVKEMTINVIDAIEILSDRLCERLEKIIRLSEESNSIAKSSTSVMTIQRSARQEAISNFKVRY